MNTPNTPTFPPLPPGASWDQQAQAARFAQTERSIAAHKALADSQTRNETALREVLAAEARIKSRADLITLVSTMTSAERRDPAKAVAKAQAELAAIDRALGL